MKKYNFITIGGSTEDIFFTVDDYAMFKDQALHETMVGFEYGSKIGIKDMHAHFGGGAANTAVALARLGFKTAIVTSVGNDEVGDRIIDNFKKHKIDCRYLETKLNNKSGRSLVLKVKEADHILFTYRGANDDLKISHKLSKKLRGAKRLYITSLTGNWRETLKEIFAVNRSVVWNPGRKQLAAGYQTLKDFLFLTDILILNKDEAIELVNSASHDKKIMPVSMMLKKLYKFGPRLVVITEGKAGAQVFDGKKIYKQKATHQKAIDTTGVGDAFGATFVAAYDEHKNIGRALKSAMKNSGSVVTKLGAQRGLLTKQKLGF